MATPGLWSVLAIVVVTGGGAALLMTQEPPAEATAAHNDPGLDPLDLDAEDCLGVLNATLQVACDAANLLPTTP